MPDKPTVNLREAFDRFGAPAPTEPGLYLYAPDHAADAPSIVRVQSGSVSRGPILPLWVGGVGGPFAPRPGRYIAFGDVFAALDLLATRLEPARCPHGYNVPCSGCQRETGIVAPAVSAPPKVGDRVTPENVGALPVGAVVWWQGANGADATRKIGPDAWEYGVYDQELVTGTPAFIAYLSTPEEVRDAE